VAILDLRKQKLEKKSSSLQNEKTFQQKPYSELLKKNKTATKTAAKASFLKTRC
jgi:hypothetical protein|tara:strand:- start:1183 stop:1344 length:162 start_codon:yes stop_codon:yes gene_type:complete